MALVYQLARDFVWQPDQVVGPEALSFDFAAAENAHQDSGRWAHGLHGNVIGAAAPDAVTFTVPSCMMLNGIGIPCMR